jgi:hypothetical protein
MPFLLFLVSVAGFVIASGYFVYCSLFGARLLARCTVPGDVYFDLNPRSGAVEVTARLRPGEGAMPDTQVSIELEREGSWLWTQRVRLDPGGEVIHVRDLRDEHPGRYRLRAAAEAPRGRAPVIAVDVHLLTHEPRLSVYLLAGTMLVGGFVTLLVVLI